MKKILFTLLILSTLVSCQTKHTYILQSIDSDDLFLYKTTSKDTVQMIENANKYLSSVPFHMKEHCIVEVRGVNYYQDTSGKRDVTPYIQNENSVVWTDVKFHIEDNTYFLPYIIMGVLIVVLIIIIVHILNAFSGAGRRS